MLDHLSRTTLATLPTHLERGPELPGGARLWVKRDDLTGLGMGGNKARKLEFLCAAALEEGADTLITVGAAQSNHCRMTAAAGARLGLEVHLVLSGDRPDAAVGNQVLSTLFGAQLHFTGIDGAMWGELSIATDELAEELTAQGLQPYVIPIGGSTAVGALGYVDAYIELMQQCDAAGIAPAAVFATSGSGGTHAGLVAGRVVRRAAGQSAPPIIGIGISKGIVAGMPEIAALAVETLTLINPDGVADGSLAVADDDVELDPNWLGENYGIPTDAGDAAIKWGATHGGWVLDRVYSGKGLSGVIGAAEAGRFGPGDDVVFIHTGGMPSVFVPQGAPT